MIPSELLPLRILIADDDDWSVQFLTSLLRAQGFERVEGITESKRVANAVRADVPDLLVLDLHMPDPDGFAILAGLRESLPADVYMPVLVVTADDTPETRRRVLRAGAADFLTKPYEESEVVLRVINQLRVRWQHVQLKARKQRLDMEVLAHQQIADEMAAATARMGALLENQQSGVLVEDENQRVSLVNHTFCQLMRLDQAPSDLLGVDARVLAGDCMAQFADPQGFAERRARIIADKTVISNEELQLADGRVFERDFVPIFFLARSFGHLWAYRDITQRKRGELALKEVSEEALKSARVKSEFLANMSHEIRTPINGVQGMLSLLASTPLSGDQNYLLQNAIASADSLLAIINEILDFSKIEAGKLVVDDVVFSPLTILEEALLVVAGAAQTKGLELMPWVEPDVPRRVHGDAVRVRQILTNFLSNAVKFTAAGEVVVRVSVTQGPASSSAAGEHPPRPQLRVEVSDTGTGIDSGDIDRLFEPFVQGDGSPTRRYGGTGLGLAISRQLAELMGGHVGVESVLGRGSTFWFSWPLIEELDSAEETDQPPNFVGVRALIVEDNATARLLLLKQLELWGIAGAGTPSGVDAVTQLLFAASAGQPYDMVLVDAELATDQARELATHLEADALLSGVQLVLMTPLRRARSESAYAAVAARIPKPVRPSQLLEVVTTVIGSDTVVSANLFPGNSRWEIFEVSPPTGTHILVADDNEINREVVVRWLLKWGHGVTAVANGREAVDAVKMEPYDLIFMDCQMPEMDGYEAAARIRSEESPSRHAPIVAVTAHALQDDRDRCLQAGMDDYIPKPIRTEDLSASVAKWVGRESGFLKNGAGAPGFVAGSEAAATPAESDSHLDESMLKEILEAIGEDGFAQLAEMFIGQVPVHHEALRSAAADGDATRMARAAHTLKGMSLQFGASEVAGGCLRLEQQVKAGDLAGAVNTVQEIVAALDVAADELGVRAGLQ